MGYTHPDAVVTAPSGVKIDPYDPAFSARTDDPQDESLPAVYLFSNTRSGDGPAYSMAEDGTVLGEHWCSHRGYMRADLRALLDCDAIFMLPGWRESRGATVEHAVAVACGIPVL
jgi:hypothetical protein